MQTQASTSSTSPLVPSRFAALIWSCLDADLHKSAVFYAERYYVMYQDSHDARHLYATALLRVGQPHTAHQLVNMPACARCSGCLEVKSKCYSALGRHRQSREALEACLRDPKYTPTPSMSSRTAHAFPEESVLHCRSGAAAIKSNQHDVAQGSFRMALSLNPMLWEAFEGLCSLGQVPEIDELFPPRLPPQRTSADDSFFKSGSGAAAIGFFTPDQGANASNVFWDGQQIPFRIGPSGPRDSISTVDSSFFPDDSFQYKVPIVPSRSQPGGPSLAVQSPAVRPLSSSDETGPVPKKLRSAVHQHQRMPPPMAGTGEKTQIKPSKSAGAVLQGAAADNGSKSSKARARPALTIANIFSSPGRRAQNAATSSRSAAQNNIGGNHNNGNKKEQSAAVGLTRRSSRLMGTKPSKIVPPKVPAKERRRVTTRAKAHSDSEMEEDQREAQPPQVAAAKPPFQPAQVVPAAVPTQAAPAALEQAAREKYEIALADSIIYDLMRMCARATRALAVYDCRGCLEELERLPPEHQRSPWVMAMVGKAHYELNEYSAAERAFEAVRNLEPYRMWDMEVYSTLLWHLQRNVKLSFLAQELLSIDPRAPQAWIAVGNCFSLQKERVQALTCFHRASQLDPACAYAYTLSGHESIDDDLDKAVMFFQAALRADPRHYNAWYGLGTCYMRMSKLRLAEYHYRKAASIHPQNAVLLGCVGMVQERYGKLDEALALFNEAVRLSAENALVRYHRAKVLIAKKQYRAAIEDLEALRDTSPDESNVIFQLAKVYRLVGDQVKSAQTLAIARDVSPKSINKIRKLLETVKDETVDDQMDVG